MLALLPALGVGDTFVPLTKLLTDLSGPDDARGDLNIAKTEKKEKSAKTATRIIRFERRRDIENPPQTTQTQYCFPLSGPMRVIFSGNRCEPKAPKIM
jgi:hypothetical protein